MASSTRCRSKRLRRTASTPPHGLNLSWLNPDGAAQADLFFARGTRVFRVADAPAGQHGGKIRAGSLERAFTLIDALGCLLPRVPLRAGEPGCGSAPERSLAEAAVAGAVALCLLAGGCGRANLSTSAGLPHRPAQNGAPARTRRKAPAAASEHVPVPLALDAARAMRFARAVSLSRSTCRGRRRARGRAHRPRRNEKRTPAAAIQRGGRRRQLAELPARRRAEPRKHLLGRRGPARPRGGAGRPRIYVEQHRRSRLLREGAGPQPAPRTDHDGAPARRAGAPPVDAGGRRRARQRPADHRARGPQRARPSRCGCSSTRCRCRTGRRSSISTRRASCSRSPQKTERELLQLMLERARRQRL